jgi:hypothetical protein
MKRIDFLKVLALTMLATILISGCVSVVAQQPPARTQATPQTKPSPYGSAANAATRVKLPAGSITGFVYWEMNVFQPQADCQGLTVKVITVNKSGMPLQLLSTTSPLTASGPVTDYSAMGTPKYMLCSYSFHDMPERVSLRTLLYGIPSTASVATPAAFQISGGNCNSTPQGTLSFILTGGPMLCGDGAYNINFKLTASASAISRSPENSTLLRSAGGGQPQGLMVPPASQNSNVSGAATSVTGGATLLPTGPGTGSPVPPQSNNGALPKDGGQAAAGATDLPRQSAAATTPGATRQTLTNADVLKMLKGGVPESVIVSSIQSAAHKFDFSPASCQQLRAVHITRQVLDAMGAGGVQPCTSAFTDPHGKSSVVPEKPGMVPSEQKTLLVSQASGPGDGRQKADGLNPRSGPPPSKATDPEVVGLLQKLGAGKSGPVVKRPQVARENAAILAVLAKQRTAADVEAAQVKLRIQPTTLAGAGGSPTQLMSASGGAGTLGRPPGAGGDPSTLQRGSSNGGSSGSTGNIPSSIAHEHLFNNTAIICSTDPTFRILSVSGSADPATFTPIEQYDLYTITGCSFGNTSGKVSIYGTGAFQQNFIVKFWSENSIVVSLDSNLSGLPDFDNITLVVQRNDNLQTQKPGFKFYAARQTVPLKMIPSSWVRLMYFPFSVRYSSPPSDEPVPGPNAGSAYVSRYADGIKYDPSAPEDCLTSKAYCPLNVDYYDFSQLAPGWTTDSFQVTTYPQSCPFTVTYREDFGTWNWDWAENNPNNIRGYLSDTTCSGFFAGMPLKNYRNWTGSYYALQVWVSGPRGLDPLTNQPVSQ